jgi:UDP-N-acetylglucosamine transferase subunit ALG13
VIFVTVGTELAFDRLVQPIDEWAFRHGRTDVFAQIGPTTWHPRHVEWANFLDAPECRRRIAAAQVVIAHAGMGTILLARELGKPILVMPRHSELHEHRTDHQLATVRGLAGHAGIIPVMDESELLQKLDHLDDLPPVDRIPSYASRELLDNIRSFIELGVTSVGANLCAGKDGPERPVPALSGEDVLIGNAQSSQANKVSPI